MVLEISISLVYTVSGFSSWGGVKAWHSALTAWKVRSGSGIFFFFFVGGGGGGQAFRMLDVEDYMIESRWRAPGAA